MEGAGKSTLAEGLALRLRKEGCRVLLTREPGGCELGQRLRALLLDARSTIGKETELFLFLADRSQHVEEVLKPALEAGTVVLCDRYIDSTIVYQGCGRGFDLDTLVLLNRIAVRGLYPDMTFILDLPPAEGLKRARRRNASSDATLKEGRFEAEHLRFHEAVRQGFLSLASREASRCVVLDAMRSPEDLLDAAWRHVLDRIGQAE